jgi:hypothetical protein
VARRVRTVVDVFDDLSGDLIPEGEADKIVWAMDGISYEIDLHKQRADEFRELFKPLVQASRRVGRHTIPMPTKGQQRHQSPGTALELAAGTPNVAALSSSKKDDMQYRALLKIVRAWARENGFPDQSDTGRLINGVRQAWNEAHPGNPVPDERKQRP